MMKTQGSGFGEKQFDLSEAIFERLILIVPYKSPEMVK
jgi:hypothetical protein